MRSPRSIDEVASLVASGANPKFLFFWGHTPPHDGSVSKACFSQWWESSFGVDEVESTGSRVLAEASPVDRIWGIGMAADDRRATNPQQWPGLNLLGFALMEVRERIISS